MRLSVLFLAAVVGVAAASMPGPYKVTSMTVGGLSAGGFMAVQYHMAFSSELKGAAVFAGGPWYCAKGSESTAITTCMDPLLSKPNPQELADIARSAAGRGNIDSPANLANQNVYLYSGVLDSVVHRPVMSALNSFYEIFVNETGKIAAEFSILSEHCYPTLDMGEGCASLGSPYIGKCNYDGAGAALKQLYPSLGSKGTAVAANLMKFDQTQFGTGHSLGDTGYVYVPTACQQQANCSLHLEFHGCQQTIADLGTKYVTETGLNDWAESNNIIVVYPQVKKSDFLPSNPEGCWDWWGYAGPDYAYKTGYQMAFAHKIVDALTGASN